jgi:hypothetical protein
LVAASSARAAIGSAANARRMVQINARIVASRFVAPAGMPALAQS